MLHYILQTIAFQLFFLIVYDLFLKKETFFNWNRMYLLITAIASVALPFVKLESVRALVPQNFVVRLPEVIIGDVAPVSDIPTDPTINQEAISHFIWNWDYLLYIGMILATLILVYKIIKISILIQKNPKRWKGNLLLVDLMKSNLAFSFFHYVFLGEYINEGEREAIIAHEAVHVNQKHTWDLMLFEVFRIVFWFNPLVYMYQNRMTSLHEFIADAKSVKNGNKSHYYQNLLSQVFDTQRISFTNTFYKQSLIKKRILMLSKSRSNRIHLLKYALLIPMVFGMLVYTSSYARKETIGVTANQEMTLKELVDKYYKELAETDTKSENFKNSYKTFMPNMDNYIWSKDELARTTAFITLMKDKLIQKELEEGTLTEDYTNQLEKMTIKYNTYEDYLIYMKTDKAKSSWESQAKDGVLRLVVDDMEKLTEEEEARQANKVALIVKDEYFSKLKITDGLTTKVIDFGKAIVKEEIEIFESDDIEVPFLIIDEVPTMLQCKDLATNADKRVCLSDSIADFVNHNFNINMAKALGLTGIQRINVIFKIGKDGKIRDIKARAPHPKLEEEAIRVISLLPQMIPGKQKGETVVVPYSLPILFQVNGNETHSEEALNPQTQDPKKMLEVSFSVVDEAPIFDGCQNFSTNEERKQCTTDKITDFVNRNFNTLLAKELGLKGQQRISAIFKIDKDGKIIDIMVRAPHPALEVEAKRVVNSLPQMIPGKQNGELVVVTYSLPILLHVGE